MIFETCETIINQNKAAKDFQNFEFELIRFTSITSPFTEEEFNLLNEQELADKLYEVVTHSYKEKVERNALLTYPVIKNVFENEGDRYERIVVPFSDGIKTLTSCYELKRSL